MAAIFISIYRLFRKHRWLFWLFLTCIIGFILAFASRIHLEEDISRITGKEQALSKDETVIRNFSFAEKLIIHVYQADSLTEPDPDRLIAVANKLYDSILFFCDSSLIRAIFLKPADHHLEKSLELIDNHLPAFLDERDYQFLDSLDVGHRIHTILSANYKLLVSPASMVMKNRIARDPLNISSLVLNKLRTLQVDDQYVLYNGYIFSKDKRHLIFFITPANPPSETQLNGRLVTIIQKNITQVLAETGTEIEADLFGSAAIAVGNADQLKCDILVSLTLALIAIFLLVGWYFRNPLIPLIGFIPAFFGGGLALSVLYMVKGNVSAIALGIGSVILGLIIDYALYMINLYQRKRDVEMVIRDMAQTVFVCSLTSIGAFMCLTFLQSAVLHDLGWFASISVFGAALFALVILPQFLHSSLLISTKTKTRITFIDRIAAIDFGKKPVLIIGLALAGLTAAFFVKDVSFEKEMNSLNYLSPRMKKAEEALDRISSASLKNIYIVSTGKTLDEALQSNENAIHKLQELREKGVIDTYSGISTLLLSDSLQQVRLQKWASYWTPQRKKDVLLSLGESAKMHGFSSRFSDRFDTLVTRSFLPMPDDERDYLKTTVFAEWINEQPGLVMVTSVARVKEEAKSKVYNAFGGDNRFVLFDRQNLTHRFVDTVRVDFNTLVTLSMIFVTVLLLLSFGRIELGFATALPMFFAWLLTLGFMGLFGIRFNIFNIIISSFVFGLGVDYSILMMRGLLSDYKYGTRDLPSYRVSIFLSSVTTIFGVASLFAARHPALQSIALISVIGVISVVLVSYTYQAMLANWFLLKPKSKNQGPVTLHNMLFAIFIAWIPIASIALVLVLYGFLISPLLPVPKKRKQEIFHRIFSGLSRIYIAMNFPRHHRVENPGGETFEKPAIIISNHQSLIETPALLRLHPHILILTNQWIYRHWIFGPVARLAGFPPMAEGIDESLALIRERLDAGFSILIFPEGTRSKDGRIQRFHRGAFYIAEKLQVDVLPVLIFGSGDFLPKGNFWGKPGRLFMQILPRIAPADPRFGENYSQRSKQVRQMYREEYATLKRHQGTPEYYRLPVMLNYLFKGPVLEWYVRVKMKLEHDFRQYHTLLPPEGEILDLGCGYGYITYMLMLTSDGRRLTGVDFDHEKIAVAQNGYLKNDRISFFHADVSSYSFAPRDGILLGDVLHYLQPEQQHELLKRCMDNLHPGGVLVIREGIEELATRHRRTKLSELFSTRILRFNLTPDEGKQLWFVSSETIRKIAMENECSFEVIDPGKKSSNVFLVIRKP